MKKIITIVEQLVETFKDKAAFEGEVLCLEDEGLYSGDDSNPALVNMIKNRRIIKFIQRMYV